MTIEDVYDSNISVDRCEVAYSSAGFSEDKAADREYDIRGKKEKV